MISVQIKNKKELSPVKAYPVSATLEDVLLDSSSDGIEDLTWKKGQILPHRLPLFCITKSSSIILKSAPYLSDDSLSSLIPNPVLTPFDPPSHYVPISFVRERISVSHTLLFCHPESTIEEI